VSPDPPADAAPPGPDDPFGAPDDATGRALDGPLRDEDSRRRPVPQGAVVTADRWRLVGIAIDAVWVVPLLFVAAFWVRVTWYPSPDDEVRGFVPVLLAPAAVLSALLVGWAATSAWRLYRRRRSGWDGPVVLGALAVAVAVYSFVPSTTIVPEMPWLAVFGVGSVVAGILGERSWRRVA
jgi:hypothetical protein